MVSGGTENAEMEESPGFSESQMWAIASVLHRATKEALARPARQGIVAAKVLVRPHHHSWCGWCGAQLRYTMSRLGLAAWGTKWCSVHPGLTYRPIVNVRERFQREQSDIG
jgi:hypothetical protein